MLISERNATEVFATLAMVTLDLTSGVGTVRLAGHPPPLLLAGGSVAAVPANYGAVLGVFEHAERPASEVRLPDGDWSLLLYTDGLIEGRSGECDRRLEMTGLQALIATAQAEGVHRGRPGQVAGRPGPRRPTTGRSPTTSPCCW